MRVEEHKCDFLIKATQKIGKLGLAVYRRGGFQKNKTNKQERKKTLQGRGNQKNLHSSLTSTFRHGEDSTDYSDNAVWKFVIVNAKAKEEPASTPTLQQNEETPPELIHQSLAFTSHLSWAWHWSQESSRCSSGDIQAFEWVQKSGLPGPLCFLQNTGVSPTSPGRAIRKSVSQIHVNLGTNHLIQPNLIAFTLFF